MTIEKIKGMSVYIHSIVIPFLIMIAAANPFIGMLYLIIPSIVYTTIKKEKFDDFIVIALITIGLMLAGWADSAPLP
ncbi:hypothetical protein ACNSOL_12475 (plasmid) [Aliarcobacter lanthieri]|uniref:hypothetical protein n=1 Tax=Aliarcobacter lanthieri TaxID=1355374 RepID=UPI003AAB2679